jgi:release factor glutamine methyltransferase
VDVSLHSFYNCPHWDFTSLLLKKALNIFVQDNQRILEIGTGPLALLSTYIAKKKNLDITAVDINPLFIENAAKTAKRNGVSITLVQSDLFSNVTGQFDIVFFNPPYVPTGYVLQYAKELYTDSIFNQVWNGGENGYDTITRFLQEVSSSLHRASISLLGVSTIFIDQIRMKKLIQNVNLQLVTILSSIGNPSRIYVMKKRI